MEVLIWIAVCVGFAFTISALDNIREELKKINERDKVE
jgi:hypothetical protein